MELPKGSHVLYRKLAMKSRLGWGRYQDATVQDLIITGEQEYLIWVYYNMGMIDFLPEVLEAVGITDLIPKPGKDPEKGAAIIKQLHHESWSSMSEDERLLRAYKRAGIAKRARNAKLADAIDAEDHFCRKGVLQAINHGHIKHK